MKKQVHLICNAHIDPIWQWNWPEGASAALSTFKAAADLAERHDYVFCHNEAMLYQYVEEYAPSLFERIRRLVREGKWHIMGGWYLQPDCNMPSGESFVRQILEGRRYFMEKFGVAPKIAFNADPFGHSVGLVQILRRTGQEGYLFMRPYPHELSLPGEQFTWRGLDGSEIPCARFIAYNSPLGNAVREILVREKLLDDKTPVILWGVGNHGGGPSHKDLCDIEELQRSAKTEYLHSTPERFFSRHESRGVIDSSLRPTFPGCYTSMRRIKAAHAHLENELLTTEKILSVAWARGLLREYPEPELRDITRDLMSAQFHDVLPGTCTRTGEEAGLRLLHHGLLDAERLKVRAFMALSDAEEAAAEGEYPILVFHPHPFESEEEIDCEFMLADQNWSQEMLSHIRILDEEGRELPVQMTKEESNLNLDWRRRVVFRAKLAPFGFHRFRLFVEYKARTEQPKSDALVFEYGRKHVEIDRETGLLSSYRIDGVEYVKDGFSLVAFDDNADPWAMAPEQRVRLGTNPRAFSLSKHPDGPFCGLPSVSVTDDGALFSRVEARFENGRSRASIAYTVYKNNDFVDVDVTLFLGEIDTIVKLKLPTPVGGRLIGQCPFGWEELFTDARENVAHRFVAMEKNRQSLVLMNRDVYGNHYEDGALYTSLVRGTTYCAHPIHDRPVLPTDRFTKKMDQGENVFSFRLGVVPTDTLQRECDRFVSRPYALNAFPLGGGKKARDFAPVLEDRTVALVTVKKADGKDALLFRLHNNTDTEVHTALCVGAHRLPLDFGRFEVKTVRLDAEGLLELSELAI